MPLALNKDVAAKLVISRRTVEAHVDHILNKLGFNSRTQITALVASSTTGAGSAGPVG